MTRVADGGAKLRGTIVRMHARVMFAITIATIMVATLAWQGIGPYRLLARQPWGYVGLYQAFALMFLVALVAFIGSRRWPSRLWNASMLCAHLAPLSVIVIARNVFVATNSELFAYLGLAIHLPLIGLETFALLWKSPWLGNRAP